MAPQRVRFDVLLVLWVTAVDPAGTRGVVGASLQQKGARPPECARSTG